MEKMKNEGFVERLIQTSISAISLAIAIFAPVGLWRYVLVVFSLMVGFFATVGFCPLYVLLKIKKKNAQEKLTLKKIFFVAILYSVVFIAGTLIIKMYSK